MKKIKGVNLGNWLVLEKWMLPELFEGTGAEDEVWLNRKMNPAELKEKMKEHRDTFITEQDFAFIKEQGIWLLRIPVPYFIFGDRPPFNGCVEYLDKAFDWAEKYGLQILIDLHTVPGSQNGYDNGGLTGVCKWCKNPEEVEFALTVLERLAKRYGQRQGLYGIEVLNEPISFLVYATAPSTGKAVDKEEAKGSGYVPLPFPVIVKIVVSKILIFFGYIYIWAAGLYSGLRAAVNDKTSCCTIIDSCSQPRVYSSQARWTRNYEAFASSSLLTFVISTFTSGLRYTFSGMLQSRVLRPFHLSG